MKIQNVTTRRHLKGLGLGIALATVAATALMADKPAADWPMFGQNSANTASSPADDISIKNVRQLKVKWTVTTAGDVSARASVVNKVAYFPDWGGALWAVNTSNGKTIWSHQLSDYDLPANTHSRTSPAVVNGTVYVGTQEGAYLLALDAATGALLWKTKLEPADPFAIISTSPTVYDGVVYTGVASLAEGGSFFGINIATAPARGSAVAVNASTGALLWKTYMVPQGYSGGGIWGSNPVVDASRNRVYVSTGNNYRHPDADAPSSHANQTYGQCITAGGTAASCNAPQDYVDAVLALNMTTGQVVWARSLVTWNQFGATSGSDDWNVDCAFGGSQCPSNPGPDFDFGSAPNLITYNTGAGFKTILGAGQKSGIYYALDPDTGQVLWQTQVGPGSSLGGMEWGSASDGRRIYVQIANLYGIPHAAGSAGSWAALDPATGAILWQTADPNGAIDLGPMTVANGVVYVSSMAGAASAPTMLALDAATGQIAWRFASGSSVNAGATVVGDTVYWGSGYAHLGIPGFTGNNTFYAFARN